MAIFYLNESESKNEEMSSEQLLDNLAEACDNMMTMLDEHGGAYRKYLNIQADKEEKHLKDADQHRQKAANYGKMANATVSSKAKKDLEDKQRKEWDREETSQNKADRINDKAKRYMGSASYEDDELESDSKYRKASSLKTQLKREKEDDKLLHGRGFIDKSEYKQKFKSEHGDTGEDKLAAREPGTFKKLQDQKKAIKETCLYILSILDEI